ncbi:hypothetical protein EV715DRAFT_285330 [Schizophyllum commune]
MLSTQPLQDVVTGSGRGYVVEAGQYEFSPKENPPAGWSRLTHPNGRPYFWHKQKRVLTMAWMPDRDTGELVDAAVDCVLSAVENWRGTWPWPNDYQIVIDLRPPGSAPGSESTGVHYYLVSPEKECVLWPEDYTLEWDLQTPKEPQIIGHYLRYQFYKHWDLFPNVQTMSPSQLLRNQKVLDDALSDVMFSSTSTVSLGASELTSMIDIFGRIAARHGQTRTTQGVQLEGDWLPGRTMQRIYRDRFLNSYGQRGACTDHQPLEFKGSSRQSWFIRLCGKLLFMAPDGYLHALDSVCIDDRLAVQPWKELVKTQEWEGNRLVATILLSASVSLLSVNDLPDGIVKIACFLSALSSSTSFILVTALEWRIRKMARQDIIEAHEWLSVLNDKGIGFEILAVLLGLPYGLMVWA